MSIAGKTVTAILPVRSGSERVVHKNTRPFAGVSGGLLEVKLRQLLAVEEIDEILLDTDLPDAETRVASLSGAPRASRVRIEPRDPGFAQSSTTTDDLIRYVAPKLRSDVAIWTHVTSPLTGAELYRQALGEFLRVAGEGYDSVMTVCRVQEFIWTADAPVNYDPTRLRWPRTQDLPVWYFVNSAVFVASAATYRDRGDRVGARPFLMEMSKTDGWDVDWPEDFELAEALYLQRQARGR